VELVNLSGFAVGYVVALDGDGFERLTVIVKGTFDIGSPPRPSDEQPPVALTDSYNGDPATSALAVAGEGAPFKSACDVLVVGAAYPPGGRGTEALVGFRLGSLQKGVQVFGDRRWEGIGVHGPSRPEPFTRLPLDYARAFGGRDDSIAPPEVCEDNPVGVGFRARRSRQRVVGSPLPNFESLQKRLTSPDDNPPPVGLGPLAPHWRARRQYAGTMDEHWVKTRAPLPPRDLDPRFHQVAPADQIYPGYVTGGEQVVLTGLRPEGNLRFALPAVRADVSVKVGADELACPAPCDTVVIDAERKQVSLVWRAGLRVHGRVPQLRWIRVAAVAA
jgi:hypothetical protein